MSRENIVGQGADNTAAVSCTFVFINSYLNRKPKAAQELSAANRHAEV
jgi:hypothetical protein